MSLFTGTVSLIQLDSLYLAVSLGDTLMIGQSSEIVVSQNNDRAFGSFEYANAHLPAYHLNDKLVPEVGAVSLAENQFCIGLKTTQEADYFVLLCKQFEQVDLSDQPHNMQELPSFMCSEKMLVQGVCEYQNQVYLMTSPDKILNYALGADTNSKQGVIDA